MTKQKVLIIEDDDAIATMYTMKLELSKFDVMRAPNWHVELERTFWFFKRKTKLTKSSYCFHIRTFAKTINIS